MKHISIVVPCYNEEEALPLYYEAMLPILAEKIGVDPAVMANPLISTLTDAVSLLIYIYIAKLILHI